MSEWISVKDRLPELIKGKDYSEPVLGIVNGELGVYCYLHLIDGSREESFFAWANCYNNIDGDAEYDDEYNVTHWQPLPEPSQTEKR